MTRAICVLHSVVLILTLAPFAAGQAKNPWVVYQGPFGTGTGKHIVLISGDDQYRTEETLPQLGKILAKHHGFKCTVLFAIDPKTGAIDPSVKNNIPGLETLKTADLIIIAVSLRTLPEQQMKHIVDYIETGKPIIGMRGSTRAFEGMKGPYAKFNHDTSDVDFEGGFGQQILGAKWAGVQSNLEAQSTRGLLHPFYDRHPILTGLKDVEIWSPTEVFNVPPITLGTILVYGLVLDGSKSTDKPAKLKTPRMPIAWTRQKKQTQNFTTTLGASQDLECAGTRRLLVNAVYYCIGFGKAITPTSNVDLVGEYRPSPFKVGRYAKGVLPSQLIMK